MGGTAPRRAPGGGRGAVHGLIYAPGMHATADELVELASVLAEHGGLYASHVRGESDHVFDAVTECIEIGRRAGVPSHVSHLKVESRPMWGRAGELLALIDAERGRGADVTATSTHTRRGRRSWPPRFRRGPRLRSSGRPCDPTPGRAALVDGDRRARMGRPRTEHRLGPRRHRGAPPGAGDDRPHDRGDHGRAEARTVRGGRRTAPRRPVHGHGRPRMHEDDVRTIVARPTSSSRATHWRSPGWATGALRRPPPVLRDLRRVLSRYVREERLLSLEDAVRKMTSLPAERFGLAGRGRIAEAQPQISCSSTPIASMISRATTPTRVRRGVDLVVVNGRVAWDGSAASARTCAPPR